MNRPASSSRSALLSRTSFAPDTLPGGVVAVDAHRAFEVLFWLPTHNAVVTGDVLLGSDEGGLSLCPRGMAWAS